VSYFEFDMIASESEAFINLKNEVDAFLNSIKCKISHSIIVCGHKNTGRHSLAVYLQNKIKQITGQHIDIVNYTNYDQTINAIVVADVADDTSKFVTSVLFRTLRLRERKEDIVALSEFVVQVSSLMNNSGRFILSEKSKEKLIAYSWPGDIAELEEVLEKSMLLAHKNVIEPEHLVLKNPIDHLNFTIGEKLENVERQYILQTLFFVEQNRTKAAEVLGISIRTLRNKLNQYRQEGYL